MPLVARVTFVILVLSTFAAFFVAQRLKSEPPVINVPQITQYFSPNGDGKKDVSDIAFVIKVADEATVDVVNLDGDRVRRLVDSVPMQPNKWRRTSWDGKDDDGTVVPDGQYRLRVALRDEGRSAIVQKTMRVDTKAPTPRVCIGGPCSKRDGWENVVSQGNREIDLYVQSRSPRFATIFRVFRTDQGKPKQVTRFQRSGRRVRWDGLVDGKPLDPGVYLIQAQVNDRAGNRGLSAAEFEPGAVEGRPGLTVRGITAQPPVRPVTAGGRTEFFVDARGAEYRWKVRRVGQGRIVKRRHGQGREPRVPRAGGPLRRLPARAARRPLVHDACRSSCRPRNAPRCSWSCRRSAGSARTRSTTTRSTACRTARHRRQGALAAHVLGREGAARGLRGGHRAAARVPGPPEDPVRPHQ